jgi:hypothetical protein
MCDRPTGWYNGAMTTDPRVSSRASELRQEEGDLPSDEDLERQAAAILEDSDERQADREAAPGTVLEHRRSEDTVDLT